MSTFDGIVEEFPYIQIDYFHKSPERPPPLACFLSHVHSDHLQGLESFRAPFIYCSPTTRELLLRIEKYPHRMNFNKGILESRKLHYKHLYKLLRPIPLNTPTEIELTPRLSIRVTLLDANHCAGAVMFLIEGDGKAIIYTGDIRAESWWVNSLIRNPILIPYTLGNKRLEKLYLDSTFAVTSNIYREFPSKAEGLAELFRKIERYPDDTIFYFRAWTFGYEDVWLALSAALNTNVHVDRYQMGLYTSLSMHARGGSHEASSLCGFDLGNRFVPGCLSNDEKSRVHSCEPGTPCNAIKSSKAVYIFPIINRLKDGTEIAEEGAGGGAGDLYQAHELELPDQSALEELEKLCLERISDSKAMSRIRQTLLGAFRSKSRTLSLDSYGMKDDYDVPLETLVSVLSRGRSENNDKRSTPTQNKPDQPLPSIIRFPYSRHSSYTELRHLVSAFKPRDIYPCTVDPLTWTEDVSMENLFGDLCSGDQFSHDAHMRELIEDDQLRPRKRARYDEELSQESTQRSSSLVEGEAATFTDNMAQSPDGKAPIVKSVTRADTTHTSIIDLSHIPPTIPLPSQSSSEDRNRIPSSLETINTETTNQQTDPLKIPKLPPEAEKAKRRSIHEAWKFLKSHEEASAFHIEALPSSWSTEAEAHSSSQHPKPSRETELGHEFSRKGSITSNSNPSESQLTNQLSISDSAFSSQGLIELPTYEDDLITTFDNANNDTPNTRQYSPSSEPSSPLHLRQNSHPTLSSSSRLRREAYLAARADSYEAWSSVALLSAGNNHTEEEIEL